MGTPNFCSWQAILDQVGASLHVQPASGLPTEWTPICSHAAHRAAAELRTIFTLKGYDPSLLSSWDDSYTYSHQLGTYFALTAGTALATYDTKQIEWMDIRKELREAAALIINGVATPPGGTAIGGISSGRVTTADDALRRHGRRRWDGGGRW
jgi:hypothetical protein